MTRTEAQRQYVEGVDKTLDNLVATLEVWKDEMDPRVPDEKCWVPEEEAEERARITAQVITLATLVAPSDSVVV